MPTQPVVCFSQANMLVATNIATPNSRDAMPIVSRPAGISNPAQPGQWVTVLAKPVDLRKQVKGPWSREEDQLLLELVQESNQLGIRSTWTKIAESMPWRTGKQCRDRWMTYLSPNIKKLKESPWTEQEDNIILEGWRKWGGCWSKISRMLEGRPPPHVKNRFYGNLKHMTPDSFSTSPGHHSATEDGNWAHSPESTPEFPSIRRTAARSRELPQSL